MRTSFLYTAILLLLVSGCAKKESIDPCSYDPCGVVAPASEIQSVQSYLSSNSLTAIQHCSGAFYIIDVPGAGSSPTICSYINTKYTGRLTDATVFDQGTFQQPLQLGALIRGWANTLPLIKTGGKMRLFLPPSLGYGNRPAGSIPANSILIFDIELTTVQ
ncbi:MAG: FKBP-type peptidyl-prolyl cis-trans isomerase [Chitinophagaceae bacterium]